jgi:SAM-dependent methyltransferase
MQIEDISDALTRGAEGIYTTLGSHDVSYAADGHAQCFQVEDGSFWFRHRNACIAAMVRNHPFEGPLLDIGGGNGYVSQQLVRDGNEVVLLEPGPTGAHNARVQRGLDHVVCSTVEDAAFHPGSFGAIGLFDVVEHIQNDRTFLESVSPLLVPGGKIFISVPCHSWLWSKADVEAGHFRRHTKKSLQTLLEGIFSIDYLSYFFRPLVPLQFGIRAAPYRLGLETNDLLSSEAEHGSGNGLSVKIIDRLLAKEVGLVARGKQMGFGASCLVAAHKKSII